MKKLFLILVLVLGFSSASAFDTCTEINNLKIGDIVDTYVSTKSGDRLLRHSQVENKFKENYILVGYNASIKSTVTSTLSCSNSVAKNKVFLIKTSSGKLINVDKSVKFIKKNNIWSANIKGTIGTLKIHKKN